METATHTYVVGGLTDGDDYEWGISLGSDDHTTDAGNYTVNGGITLGTSYEVSGGSASVSVTWNAGSEAQTYYLFIEITDGLGCSTFRSLLIDPVPYVDYTVNFDVVALLAGDDATAPATIAGETGGTDINGFCATYFGEDLLSTSLTDVTTDGQTYVFFRVTRTSTVNSGWTFTPNGTDGLTWAISTDAAVTFNAYTDATAQNISSGTNIIYLRATVPASTSTQDIALSIDAPEAFDAGGVEVDAESVGVNAATLEVLPLPAVATAPFGTSF